MTMPLTMRDLDGSEPRSLAPFSHMRQVEQPSSSRLAGLGVVIAAHVGIAVLLVVGIQIAKPALQEKPIMVDVVKTEVKPQTLRIASALTQPTQISVAMPVVDIAPAPTAIAAAPVKAAPPPPTAPAAIGPKAVDGAGPSYESELLGKLQRLKRYPAQARSAHIEGVVMLHFIVDRSGHVLSAEIAKSSGRPVLDSEAMALIHRAEPLPPMPDSMPGASFNTIVPVQFFLHDE